MRASTTAYPTSAYPRHYPRRWLLRMSFLPYPCGWFPTFLFLFLLFDKFQPEALLGIIHIARTRALGANLLRFFRILSPLSYSDSKRYRVSYFVPMNYFAIDLGSFNTPRDIASTLPSDLKHSDGSFPLSIFRARRVYSAIGW